jgi:peroxiredoxin
VVDAQRQAAGAYGVLKPNGKSIERTVVIVDRQGVVRYVKKGMPSTVELLKALQGL